MTLVEFIAPVVKSTNATKVLVLLFYKDRYENVPSLNVTQIGVALKSARVPNTSKINVSDVLNKCGSHVNRVMVDGKPVWEITESGKAHVRTLLKLPLRDAEIEHDVTTLSAMLPKIPDADIREYFAEGLKCLQADALRATVVFIWLAAIRTVQQNILKHSVADINNAIKKHDPKAHTVTKLDDFSYIKDKLSLLAAKELGELDKSQKDALEEALNLRNKCGHPVKYNPGVKKVSGFIEDVISILFI
jgi:hypothetical protein